MHNTLPINSLKTKHVQLHNYYKPLRTCTATYKINETPLNPTKPYNYI